MSEISRDQACRDFVNAVLVDVGNAITKAGGDKERFWDDLFHKDVMGTIDEAMMYAFEGVEEIKYQGIL